MLCEICGLKFKLIHVVFNSQTIFVPVMLLNPVSLVKVKYFHLLKKCRVKNSIPWFTFGLDSVRFSLKVINLSCIRNSQ